MEDPFKKVVVVGGASCGKTSLILALMDKYFFGEYIPKVLNEDHYIDIKVKGIRKSFCICDTAGDDVDFKSYPETDVFLICFSIDNPTSLEKIPEQIISDVRFYCPTAPIVLIGNKKDLRTDEVTIHELAMIEQEPVKVEHGRAMAEKIGAYSYVECSAKLKEGIMEVFETAARVVLPKKNVACTMM